MQRVNIITGHDVLSAAVSLLLFEPSPPRCRLLLSTNQVAEATVCSLDTYF